MFSAERETTALLGVKHEAMASVFTSLFTFNN